MKSFPIETIERLNRLFNEAIACRSSHDLLALMENNPDLISEKDEFEKKYPRLNFCFTKEDIETLSQSEKLSSVTFQINLEKHSEFTPLEKLLIAVTWKNGMFDRIRPVAEGILDKRLNDSKYGVIFRQFGKHLANWHEPIVDQHVLRAYVKFANKSPENLKRLKSLNRPLNSSHQLIIEQYVGWIKNLTLQVEKKQRKEFMYLLDKLLFLIGKTLKPLV